MTGSLQNDGRAGKPLSGSDLAQRAVDPQRADLFCTPFWRRRWRKQAKSTRSSSWSWLKQENTTDSLPVTGSLWSCRHWAQISFIMHCMGELIDPSARWSTFR